MENTNSICVKEYSDTQSIKLNFSYTQDFNKICNILSDYILENYEPKLIYKIVFKNIEFFTKNQKREIYEAVIRALKQDTALYQKRHNMIYRKLQEYFKAENTIIIDGFVVFRLSDYFGLLETYVLTKVDEYLVKKDYDEFLALMKYFVNLSTPKCKAIDAYFDGKEFHIYDESKQEITDLFAKDLLQNYDDVIITQDDIFLSLLISIAPAHICIHNTERIPNKELLQTVQKVFGSRVSYQNDANIKNSTSKLYKE